MQDDPIREIRPVVVPAHFFVAGLPIAGFISLFPGFFAFVLSNIVNAITGDPFDGPIIGVGLGAYVVSVVICLALMWVKVFVEPGRTRYAIYSDRIEYDEGLWNRHRRTLVFDQVIDVHLTEGVLQQTRGAGTVTVVTQQLISRGEGGLTNRRIALRNLPEPRDAYDLIRSLALDSGDA